MEKKRTHLQRPLAAITGASSGIGADFARSLAQRGYDLLLIARRADRLKLLADELSQSHAITAEILPADLAIEADLECVEQRLQKAELLEFLVNNAGFGTRQFFYQADLQEQDRMHRLHVIATMRLCRVALSGMVARDRGWVVNVSSVAGFIQGPFNVSYCATKAWMSSFSEGLALEMRSARKNVCIQALCPGFTKTEFHASMGLSRDFLSDSWWMESAFVVASSLRGCDKNQWLVVPGWRYKMLVGLLKIIPRALLHRFAQHTPNVRRAKVQNVT